MKELKILAIVVFFSLLTYYLVEPFAHSKMHKHIEGHGFVYDGMPDIEEAKAKGDPKLVAKKQKFWAEVHKIAAMKGDVKAGEAAFATCLGCHTGQPVDMGGVIPPKLDHAGSLYDKNFLIALLKDPAMAQNVDHKYKDTSAHPMGPIKSMMSDDKQIADVVAYIKAKKSGIVTPKNGWEEACGRCHAVRYMNWTQLGWTPKFKHKKDELAYKLKVLEQQEKVKKYMGKLPPDLSTIIRSRSEKYLETFVENPQTQLPGTSMPRVGVTREGYETVKKFLEESGDPSKPEREALGPWVLGYWLIFAILAYLWYDYQWRELH